MSQLPAWMPRPGDAEFQDLLRAALDDAVDLHVGPEAPRPPEHRVLIAGRPSAAELAASPRIEAVVIPWAGVPPATLEILATRPELSLHVLHHGAAPTAELCLALLLAAAKRVVPFDQALRRGDWRPRHESDGGILLEGRRALVLGFGAIGRRVARACLGLGMEVLATRRRASAVEAVQLEGAGTIELHPAAQLGELLAVADAILCCLPETRQTRGLLGRSAFERVRRGAILINVGRGPVIDEEALHEALLDGRIGAAGLDVWWQYPPDEDGREATPPSRLAYGELPNVVLSPHRGGHSDATPRLRAEALASALNAAARGEALPNAVDRAAGY